MKNILNRLFHINPIIPPEVLKKAFEKRFGNSLNVEWLQADDVYEAIFYLDEIEHLARYDSNGKLLNYKKNLPLKSLPPEIEEKITPHGELMNIIAIFDDNGIAGYELIVRDESLIRYSLILGSNGGVIQKTKL